MWEGPCAVCFVGDRIFFGSFTIDAAQLEISDGPTVHRVGFGLDEHTCMHKLLAMRFFSTKTKLYTHLVARRALSSLGKGSSRFDITHRSPVVRDSSAPKDSNARAWKLSGAFTRFDRSVSVPVILLSIATHSPTENGPLLLGITW